MIDPTSAADDLPQLTDPLVVVAFEGWNDAGDAATGAVEHLELIWNAQPLAALDPEDYYDFQVNRPTVSLVGGISRRIEWPTTRISVITSPVPNPTDVRTTPGRSRSATAIGTRPSGVESRPTSETAGGTAGWPSSGTGPARTSELAVPVPHPSTGCASRVTRGGTTRR